MQDFIQNIILTTRFFYWRCFKTDQAFVDAVVETVTYILFTCRDNNVHNLLKSKEKILKSVDVKLADLKLIIDVEEPFQT